MKTAHKIWEALDWVFPLVVGSAMAFMFIYHTIKAIIE